MIGPSEVIDIGSSITGVIDRILVERSEYVEAGEVLAQLEASVERAAVRVARARAERTVDIDSSAASYDLGEKRRSRALELFDSKALSLDQRQEVEAEATLAALELERAREDHRLASLQLEQAAAALERRTIRSPVAGFVVERMMAPGEVVDEQTILRIAQVHPLRIEAILPSDWFGRVRPGDQAEIVPETPLDQPRAAREVDQIDDRGCHFFCAASAQIVGDGIELVGIAAHQEERVSVGCKMLGGLLRDRGSRTGNQDSSHGPTPSVTRRQRDEEKRGSMQRENSFHCG